VVRSQQRGDDGDRNPPIGELMAIVDAKSLRGAVTLAGAALVALISISPPVGRQILQPTRHNRPHERGSRPRSTPAKPSSQRHRARWMRRASPVIRHDQGGNQRPTSLAIRSTIGGMEQDRQALEKAESGRQEHARATQER
jgi:hypothetical protein